MFDEKDYIYDKEDGLKISHSTYIDGILKSLPSADIVKSDNMIAHEIKEQWGKYVDILNQCDSPRIRNIFNADKKSDEYRDLMAFLANVLHLNTKVTAKKLYGTDKNDPSLGNKIVCFLKHCAWGCDEKNVPLPDFIPFLDKAIAKENHDLDGITERINAASSSATSIKSNTSRLKSINRKIFIGGTALVLGVIALVFSLITTMLRAFHMNVGYLTLHDDAKRTPGNPFPLSEIIAERNPVADIPTSVEIGITAAGVVASGAGAGVVVKQALTKKPKALAAKTKSEELFKQVISGQGLLVR